MAHQNKSSDPSEYLTKTLENAAHEAAMEDGLIPTDGNNASELKAKKAGLRRGKWTAEEESYANRLIFEFKLGLLPLTDGTTLRTFLSKLLNCDPMRISKKFVGQNCIGKQVFRRRQQELEKLTPEQIELSRKELAELERKFLDRVAQTNRGKNGSVERGKDDSNDENESTPDQPILAPWMVQNQNQENSHAMQNMQRALGPQQSHPHPMMPGQFPADPNMFMNNLGHFPGLVQPNQTNGGHPNNSNNNSSSGNLGQMNTMSPNPNHLPGQIPGMIPPHPSALGHPLSPRMMGFNANGELVPLDYHQMMAANNAMLNNFYRYHQQAYPPAGYLPPYAPFQPGFIRPQDLAAYASQQQQQQQQQQTGSGNSVTNNNTTNTNNTNNTNNNNNNNNTNQVHSSSISTQNISNRSTQSNVPSSMNTTSLLNNNSNQNHVVSNQKSQVPQSVVTNNSSAITQPIPVNIQIKPENLPNTNTSNQINQTASSSSSFPLFPFPSDNSMRPEQFPWAVSTNNLNTDSNGQQSQSANGPSLASQDWPSITNLLSMGESFENISQIMTQYSAQTNKETSEKVKDEFLKPNMPSTKQIGHSDHPHPPNPQSNNPGMQKNSSVENFWLLVNLGDLPRPEQDVLSETLWQAQQSNIKQDPAVMGKNANYPLQLASQYQLANINKITGKADPALPPTPSNTPRLSSMDSKRKLLPTETSSESDDDVDREETDGLGYQQNNEYPSQKRQKLIEETNG